MQQIHSDGTEQCMTEHEPEIGAIGNDDNGLLAGKEPQVNGNDGRNDDQSTRHLIHQYGTTADAHADLFVTDGVEGTHCGGSNAYGDAIAIAGVEREDAEHTRYGNQREEEFEDRKALLEDDGLEEGCKETYQRETNDTNGYIRGLDAAVEQYPVEAQQGTTATELQELLPPHSRQAGKDHQDAAGEQHAIPHDIDLVERDESSKQSGKTC